MTSKRQRMSGRGVGLVALAALAGIAPPAMSQEQRFADWTSLPFSAAEYRLRRQRVIAQLQQTGGGVLLVPSADGRTQGATFRQDDDFLYLTGLELPQSVLAIDADEGRSVLFVPARDTRFAHPDRPDDYPGRPLADDPALGANAGLPDIRTFDQFEPTVAGVVADGRLVRINAGRVDDAPPPVTTPFPDPRPATALWRHLRRHHPTARVENAFAPLARIRMIKSPAEIAVLRRAAGLTATAVMAGASAVADGVDERTVAGAVEAACRAGGSQRAAFHPIVKSGPNALWPWRILAAHYDRRNRRMHAEDVVIFDVGCELDYYAADVGRTFPVGGRFSDEQREAVRLVTTVSDAMIDAIRPGLTLNDVHAVAVDAIPTDARRYMQGGFFGHHIGLAVGDPSLRDTPLAPGMVLTVEPWYYNRDRQVAAFVEDMVVVTAEGATVLTRSLPRAPVDLERLVGVGRR